MINAIFFGINILLALLIWKYVLRPSILDHYRDQLFDLREEVRNYYIKNELPLNDQTYKNLRDLINSHLRFTEKLSFVKVVSFSNKIERDHELQQYTKEIIDSMFSTNDKRLSQYIEMTRAESTKILMNYMILSSPVLIAAMFVISCIFIQVVLTKGIMKSTSLFVTKHLVSKDSLEKISFETMDEQPFPGIA